MASPSVDLEQVFGSIEEGNKLLEQEKCWEAAKKYCWAQEKLNALANSENNNSSVNKDEEAKIVELCRNQGREYLKEARESLALAIQREAKSDSEKDELTYSSLSEEDIKSRVALFCKLFGGTQELRIVEDKTVKEQENSLADRLEKLNKNLPKGFKTSDERMRDINRGLNRLGLSLYSQADEKPKIDLPKSEDDQLKEILALAKDEARLEPTVPGDTNDSIDDSESVGSAASSSIDDSVGELDLEDRKEIQDQVVEAQAKLSELIALLEVEDGNAQKFDQRQARFALKSTRRLLQKAAKCWDDALV